MGEIPRCHAHHHVSRLHALARSSAPVFGSNAASWDIIALTNRPEAFRITVHQALIDQDTQHGLFLITVQESFSWLAGFLQQGILPKNVRCRFLKKSGSFFDYPLTELMQLRLTSCFEFISLLFK